jgi:hypothetical protein
VSLSTAALAPSVNVDITFDVQTINGPSILGLVNGATQIHLHEFGAHRVRMERVRRSTL